MKSIISEIKSIISLFPDTPTRQAYEQRLPERDLCRSDNPTSHFCAYFVPFNRAVKQVLVGNHKKSGLWLMPGGHIESDEPVLTTLNREISEELGVESFFGELPVPFLITITQIVSDIRPCKEHFDIWFLMETDGIDFTIDYTEYHEVRWVSLLEAQTLITDPANCEALSLLTKF